MDCHGGRDTLPWRALLPRWQGLGGRAPGAYSSPVPNPARASATPPGAVFDAHVDALQRSLDLDHDLGERTPGQFDLVRATDGGLGAAVFVAWVDPRFIDGEGGAARRCDALLSCLDRLLRRHPELVALATCGPELEAVRASGRVAAIAGIEGGHPLGGSLERLERYHARGVRVLTLVWNNHLSWVRSCRDGAGPDVPAGLSRLGREVVARMNDLGMLVDLSHAGERSFYDALDASTRPVMASHSGCRALHDHPRNLTDDQLRSLAENGGVVGIVFYPPFLDAESCREAECVRASAEYRSLVGSNDAELFLRQGELLRSRVQPMGIERVCDHVLHACEVAGPEHVGIGSDFDGIEWAPAGLEDASCYPLLAAALRERGLVEADVLAVLGGNMRRVFDAATAPAAG